MVLPLESALSFQLDERGLIAGHTLEDWNAAYARVEGYFNALRVRNKLLLGQLVSRVLDHAIARAKYEPTRPPVELAAEEMDRVVTDWFTDVLKSTDVETDPMLSDQGRLALLLADMPGKWQHQFLKPGPWPEEFVHSMKASFLRAGPDFQVLEMRPRPINLGPITALTNLGNFPYFRILLLWLAFALACVIFFQMTH